MAGKLGRDVLVESVLRAVDGASEHRLVGGRDDGRDFATLAEVSTTPASTEQMSVIG